MGATRANFMEHKNNVEQTLIMTILMDWRLQEVITGKHWLMAFMFW